MSPAFCCPLSHRFQFQPLQSSLLCLLSPLPLHCFPVDLCSASHDPLPYHCPLPLHYPPLVVSLCLLSLKSHCHVVAHQVGVQLCWIWTDTQQFASSVQILLEVSSMGVSAYMLDYVPSMVPIMACPCNDCLYWYVCRQMVDIAQAEERVILTCDRTFIRMGYSDQAFYVRTTNKQEQVREVLAHFNISVREDSLLSRCAKCNGTFFPRYATTATSVS